MQLIYGGQPFIFEKTLKLSSGEEKRFWRCNQWWNQKCRSRVFTINDVVCPLNRFHTHEEIVRRKKRVRRVPPVETIAKVVTTAGRQEQQQQTQQQQEIQLTSDAMLTTALEDESPATIDVSELGMHLKYEEIVADVTGIFFFTKGQRESIKLNYGGHSYVKFMENGRGTKWICATRSTTKCRARIRTTKNNRLEVLHAPHNHDLAPQKKERGRLRQRIKTGK
ncbi:hypothetical protein M5D96_002598 [Drosophila gunungcola]|uniref:FLYWCH-type domain-containing protein n=1 Tax=Drosophila gunungcola TaxID=103775 RepID=A0A9P9Z0B7_9MUSC|nr:hypothetical protein M5D96_002598 [Drosophila gunungcola]